MGAQLLSSKIVIVEEEPRIRSIPALPTAVVGAVGVTERGPIGVATLVTSWEEYVNIFGSFTTDSDVATAAYGFFLNGGETLWVVRTVHYSDVDAGTIASAAKASVDLLDSTPATTVEVEGKTEGAYGNSLKILIEDATDGEATHFNLSVLREDVVVEVFPNVVADNAYPDIWVQNVVNDPDTGSQLISVNDVAPGTRPENATYGPMTGGDDGLTSIDDNDFIGSDASDVGMYALDLVQNLTLLIVPSKATSAIHQAMISYVEVHRDGQAFAVLDPPAAQSATAVVTYVETTAAILGLSEYAAIYWPRIVVLNPNKSVFGDVDQITVAPSGYVVGVYARVDSSQPGGVYQPPAGVERGVIFGCLGFDHDDTIDEKKRDIVYPKRINPITVYSGTPRHIDGSRTLKGDGNFPYVAERRGVIFIENSLKVGLLFAKHSNHTPALRARVRRTVFSFLKTQMDNDAFRSRDPASAFFVDVSEKLNPPSVVFAGKLIMRVGLATNKPAEFIIIKVSQDTRALEEELAA